MFRPFSIRPSSGLARGPLRKKLTMLQSIYNRKKIKANLMKERANDWDKNTEQGTKE